MYPRHQSSHISPPPRPTLTLLTFTALYRACARISALSVGYKTMLASPLQPVVPFGKSQSENPTLYRPTKDCEAFRALVPPVEFIEGSSTGAVAILDSKYVPINGTPKVYVARSISVPMLI